MQRLGVLSLLAAFTLVAASGYSAAADAPTPLKWAQLVPPKAQAAPNLPTFFSGAQGKGDDGSPPPPPMPEGKFMSMKRQQPGAGKPPAIVPELNGKTVAIGGYVVPLDFEATSIKEFLLVPFVGACIHVPPPPSNQIIYVKSAEGIEITGAFDPVKVTGTIKTETAFTGLADAGYSIDAAQIERMTP